MATNEPVSPDEAGADIIPAADLSNKIARLDTMFKAHEADPLNQQLKTYLIHFYSDGNHEQN